MTSVHGSAVFDARPPDATRGGCARPRRPGLMPTSPRDAESYGTPRSPWANDSACRDRSGSQGQRDTRRRESRCIASSTVQRPSRRILYRPLIVVRSASFSKARAGSSLSRSAHAPVVHKVGDVAQMSLKSSRHAGTRSLPHRLCSSVLDAVLHHLHVWPAPAARGARSPPGAQRLEDPAGSGGSVVTRRSSGSSRP